MVGTSRTNKVAWEMIFDDFKSRYPSLKEEALYFRPVGYLKILVRLSDNRTMEYDYYEHKARFVRIPFTEF